MLKFFGVWSDNNWEIIDNEIEVDISTEDESLLEEEGQVVVDVIDTKDNIIVISPIAWVDLDKIDLSLHKTVLTISGKRDKPEEYEIDWAILRNSECFWGMFTRKIILPENLALNKIKAYMENNLLIITIPKIKFDSKNIKINRVEV